ncbi:sigma-54 interaction domain-containing protein [Acinetobacter sp. MB5]|uniref:sigma-54 interaction domain-containing protein n=1 Tax=Acinetobacter sp. MB5 TaxID=2069438 RepID=UPI000DCFF4A6|nr:sigma-54 dependent transcriptional regulator [Acinetobacter sp. MB5]
MNRLLFDTLASAQTYFQQLQGVFQHASIFVLDEHQQAIWQSTHTPNVHQQAQLEYVLAHPNEEAHSEIYLDQLNSFYLKHRVEIATQNCELHLFQPCPTVHTLETTTQLKPTQAELELAERFNSQTPQMFAMFSIIQRVASTQFPVLVRGESGSGKELVAQAIHDYSERRNRPFIAVNCASLNANILESELFGHVKGAFTGAIRDHKGVFERAAGGTLFLDEVAEIPLELQAKLLRVLETGEYTQLGGEKTLKSDVRIIAATHRALREEARLGRFRQDLLYRLRVIPIFVPPLRERKTDIPLIIKKILQDNSLLQGQSAPVLTHRAMQVMLQYDWPGNIRELKNTLLYALTMSQGRNYIDVNDLPYEISNIEHGDALISDALSSKNITKELLAHLLEQYSKDLQKVADELNISRTTLWRYRKKWNI